MFQRAVTQETGSNRPCSPSGPLSRQRVKYLPGGDRRGQTCSKKKHNDIYQNMENI